METRKKLEKIFYCFLFINPLLDIANGFLMNTGILSGNITLSLTLRMLALLLMGFYLLIARDWDSVWLILPMGAAGIMSMFSEFISYHVDVGYFQDIQYITKYVYNIAAFIVYAHLLDRRYGTGDGFALLDRVFVWTSLWTSLTILITFLLNVGTVTYGDFNGLRGAKGFFYSGNEVTAVLIVLLPMCIRLGLGVPLGKETKARHMGLLFVPALSINALSLIGTKTAFLGIALTAVIIGAYCLYEALFKKNAVNLFLFVFMASATAAVFVILNLLSGNRFWDSITNTLDHVRETLETPIYLPDDVWIILGPDTWMAIDSKDTFLGRLLSGRLGYLEYTFRDWREGMLSVWFFGLGRGTRLHTIEMDFFEVFAYYGIFGSFFLIWPYARQLYYVIRAYFKKPLDITGICLMTALGVTFGYAFLAGHVMFTVTGGFYLAIVLLYACRYYGVTNPVLPEFVINIVKSLKRRILKSAK